MLHSTAFDDVLRNDVRVAILNARLAHSGATEVIKTAQDEIGNVALVSSFGADSVVLLRLVAQINPQTPVLFVDTEMLFDETLQYQENLAALLGLTNIRVIRATETDQYDPDVTLHKTNPDACCSLRKTAPLQKALAQFDGWISGRKRHQSGTRSRLKMFEIGGTSSRIKVNPLALWNAQDTVRFMKDTQMPRHPLVTKGYPSIGCTPCTTPVKPSEYLRASHWRETEKEEFGIHFVNGKMVRSGDMK